MMDNYIFEFEEIESIEQLSDFNDEYVYDIEMDDNTHTFIANNILIHNSAYTTYGNFFECWDEESKKTIETDEQKTNWILKFNSEFLDKQNTIWLNEMYEPRHCQNIHNFELETISKSGLYLKKKKYLKELVYNNGKFLIDHPKISGTGIEIIKSTTPPICRTILTNLVSLLLHEFDNYSFSNFVFYFNSKLSEAKEKFYAASTEEISNSVSIGDYKKYIKDDTYNLLFESKCPLSVKAIGRYNYLAHKNGEDNVKVYTGKIKYYYIQDVNGEITPFGFPSGELPKWAPKPSKKTQWEKNIIDPINRFLEVMEIPLVNADCAIQMNLFGF